MWTTRRKVFSPMPVMGKSWMPYNARDQISIRPDKVDMALLVLASIPACWKSKPDACSKPTYCTAATPPIPPTSRRPNSQRRQRPAAASSKNSPATLNPSKPPRDWDKTSTPVMPSAVPMTKKETNTACQAGICRRSAFLSRHTRPLRARARGATQSSTPAISLGLTPVSLPGKDKIRSGKRAIMVPNKGSLRDH